MNVPMSVDAPAGCQWVSEVLNQVGDKWTVQVVVALRDRPRRFNDIKRQVAGISQQMLTRTLKTLERDGLVVRTVRSSTPPQVDYALTEVGRSLSGTVRQLAEWAVAHRAIIHASRQRYDTSR
ncbi:MAG: transcriptional regulator [Bradyrhizobium sp. PARBB1]|jgi:DNA-binding HxlR family transcriptional regulator|uniref:winged helix-turn-helix transcriptional regulator n=1 Tax=Bradyrhizobium sp. TaxID=376 RepID=UPI000396BEB8|nr:MULTISPECIES: helix-turn-helix domain-containing protein [Bradyrhizobium]ERF86666.1 MAG: type I pantothenate kinase [Bradyrhizobium sp. DFCI-1]OYU62941.1 MAG: transcriptional regulator [Bradyrhizobium sp. PARBB1]PSO29198.1 transcriptional regulator [Bradyrhizobium sp. MOS004]MCA3566257.1 helix-turn-helix transcriptional regulator [Bradyrhizobium sp.]MCA3577300.1 helix-turn-helix transcriptional regulator [Bradyrhizobium sp.]